jgi:hypothetical protein
MSIWQGQLPHKTIDLVAALERDVEHATITDVNDLATEEGRLSVAFHAGRRNMVDELRSLLERDQKGDI